jgi:5-hydroxyisourate hydrolase
LAGRGRTLACCYLLVVIEDKLTQYNQYNAGFSERTGNEKRMGRLTTHILDTAEGRPAAGVAIRLFSLGEQREQVAVATTNTDGRTEEALLDGASMLTGTYELEFDIGDYFRSRDVAVDDPAFLDTVVLRFSVKHDEHYHVPLLCSPWSYSTYRGS